MRFARAIGLLAASLLATSWWNGVVLGDEADSDAPPSAVSYWRDIRPIFQAHCQGCHQPAKHGGDYVMTSFETLLAGGESGEAAIVAGDLDASYLVAQITPEDGVAEMPQGKPPLGDEQIALITQWITLGAIDDTPASAAKRYDAEHPPEYTALPVVTSLAYSPDGKLLAVSGYHEILLHDVEAIMNGADSLTARLVGMSERIESLAFSPDGTHLAMAGGSPGRLGEVQVWNVAEAELTLSIPVTYDTCYGISWSKDGAVVGFGCPDNTVRAIEVATGKQVLYNGAHNDWVLDTVFSVDDTHIVSVSRDRSMKLIEVKTERFIDNITSITPGALTGGLHAVDRHPTKDELLIGGADGTPKIYRMFREQERKIGDDYNLIRKFPELPGRIFDASFSRDGAKIVAGSSDQGHGHVHTYRVDDGELIAKMQEVTSAVFAVALSPDGQVVASGGFSGTVSLHEAETGKLLRTLVPVPFEEGR